MNKKNMRKLVAGCTSLVSACCCAGALDTAAEGNHPKQDWVASRCINPGQLIFPDKAPVQHSVYFDADQYVPQPRAKEEIATHARYLAAHPDVHVQLIGSTDAHGNREYNLALGQKRADSVRQAFLAYGVSDGQITAISHGSECSRSRGDDAASQATDRRVDIQYSGTK